MLTDKKALVTGAQQGIGAAAAIALARAGADVAINFLDDEDAAAGVADAVRQAGRRAVPIQGDVASAASATSLVAAAADALGGLDILVNNAGILPPSDPLDVTEEEWDRVLAVNLKGSFFCAQRAARIMIAAGAGGAIVNLSSIVVMGPARGPHYVASKGGIVTLTRSLASAWAPHGIRVNAVAPGLIDTAQPRSYLSQDQFDRVAREMIPLGRVGETSDVASAIVFLAGSGAGYITGQILHVNGGQLMR
jgi:3-oxoacyl-[acyl-carrier protein] reductase